MMSTFPVLKRLVGRSLLQICEHIPAAKPLLRRWGLRTSQEWFDGRIVSVQLPEGQTMKLASLAENYLSFELFWRGGSYYEPITTLVARELVRPGGTFIDVGANIGFYSMLLSLYQPGLRVIAFEPNPKNYGLLVANIRLNDFTEVVCEPLAVSEEEGLATLYLSPSDMSASLERDFGASSGTVQVSKTTLDSYLARHAVPGPLLLKVDVEGHESSFFKGSLQTLETRQPDILSEVTGAGDSVLSAMLKQAGYRFYQITDQGLLPAEELTLVVHDRFVFLNYLLSPRPESQIRELFQRIEGRVRRIDLRQTSKFVSPALLAELKSRQLAGKAEAAH